MVCPFCPSCSHCLYQKCLNASSEQANRRVLVATKICRCWNCWKCGDEPFCFLASIWSYSDRPLLVSTYHDLCSMSTSLFYPPTRNSAIKRFEKGVGQDPWTHFEANGKPLKSWPLLPQGRYPNTFRPTSKRFSDLLGLVDDDGTSRQTFADVVVGIALQLEDDAWRAQES